MEFIKDMLIILLPIVLGGIGWLIRESINDKKQREERQKLSDDRIGSFETLIAELQKHMEENRLDISKLEISQLISHFPEQTIYIEKCYSKYKECGGTNGYVTAQYNNWKKKTQESRRYQNDM